MRKNFSEFQPNLGGHPERMKNEGLKVHNNELVVIGHTVEAISNVAGKIAKGTHLKVANLIIEPKGDERGFYKRLVFEGIEGEFNPQRFIKVKGL